MMSKKFIFILFVQTILALPSKNSKANTERMLNYFPSLNNDAAFVTWDHGVNSWEKVHSALKSDIMFLEADILMSDDNVPIMAHPPNKNSDITFIEWLNATKLSGKGLKLDFKTQDVIEPCLIHLQNQIESIQGPVILNADILQGFNSAVYRINAEYFLSVCKKYYPDGVLSVGWTTTNSPTSSYSWSDIFNLLNLIEKFDIHQELTYPVRASWAANSLFRLLLLQKNTRSSLTIWAHETDPLTSLDSLLLFRIYYLKDSVYYDLPKIMDNHLRQNLNGTTEGKLQESSDPLIWSYLNPVDRFNPEAWQIKNGRVLMSKNAALMHKKEAKIISKDSLDTRSLNSIEVAGHFYFIKIDDSVSNTALLKISLESTSKSLNLVFYTNGIVQIQNGNNVLKEFNFYVQPNGYKLFIRHNLKSNQTQIIINDYELNTLISTVQFNTLDYKIVNNENNFVSIALLNDAYGIGIDEFRISENRFVSKEKSDKSSSIVTRSTKMIFAIISIIQIFILFL